ncbi:hypothetical protein [Pseudoalteromonas aurantia]|uniref:DUF481 domain-containing protein n=1 Tax=Pseudoalteromonas aurantia TaxID=43654 RepID=A0A5S3UXV7_9GAMM|nr:hypothetical protein [Pseudoalteromonas aurantia]TMO62539.1 hypothetical protein CWC19_20005 [Pseudoalteromonas aurantia]
MKKTIQSIVIVSFLLTQLLCTIVQAHEVYINTSKVEHTINLPQQEIAFDSFGYNAFISLDLSDALSLSFSRGEWTQTKDNHAVLVGEMAIKSVGSAAHYSINDAWYLSLSYDKWQDSIQAHNKKHHLTVYDEQNHAKSYTASLGWGKEIGSYYLRLSTSMSQTDWQSERTVSIRKNITSHTSQKLDTTVASLAVDMSHFVVFSQDTAFTYGAQLSWHQLLKDTLTQEQGIKLKRNNITRRTNLKNSANQPNQLTTEDYGQISLYAILQLGERWNADISLNRNFATNNAPTQDETYFSLGLGYQF